jgi:hypothetical protein
MKEYNLNESNRLTCIAKINIFIKYLSVNEFIQDKLYHLTRIAKINVFVSEKVCRGGTDHLTRISKINIFVKIFVSEKDRPP